MKIAIYFSPLWGVVKPTGVGRHVLEMTAGLGRQLPGAVGLMAEQRAYAAVRSELRADLAELPVRFLPGSEALMRGLLIYTPTIAVDRWADGADWIYCPKEQPVTTRNARLAVTVHDVLPFERDVPGYTRSLSLRNRARWAQTMSRIRKRADLIATVSEFTKHRMMSLFEMRDESRFLVVGNGVEPSFFRTAQADDTAVLERYGVTTGRYVMVSGGLQVRKAGDLILQLAEDMKKRRSDLQLLVTGRRHDAEFAAAVESIRSRPDQLPLRLLGYIPDNDLAPLLTHSLALLLPSRYEGFGLPAVEAMAAGTPVIYNPVASLPEIIADAGIPIAEGSAPDYEDMLRQLQNSTSLRLQYVEAGRVRAKKYTWDHCVQRLVSGMRGR